MFRVPQFTEVQDWEADPRHSQGLCPHLKFLLLLLLSRYRAAAFPALQEVLCTSENQLVYSTANSGHGAQSLASIYKNMHINSYVNSKPKGAQERNEEVK